MLFAKPQRIWNRILSQELGTNGVPVIATWSECTRRGFLEQLDSTLSELGEGAFLGRGSGCTPCTCGAPGNSEPGERMNMDLQPLPPPDWTGSLGVLSEADERSLEQKYGRTYVQDLVAWSTLLVDEAAPVRWICSVQLFFSFCLRFRRPPVFRDKEWRDLDTVRNGRLVQVPRASWVRYFLHHGQKRWRCLETAGVQTTFGYSLHHGEFHSAVFQS